MDYNYHTHTFRCRHATGTEEEYIKRAIDNGIKFMGFSEHVPLRFSDGYESFYRMPTADVEDYFSVISNLREKYKGIIDIKIGFEMEYYPNLFSSMLERVKAYGAEYLILGEHFNKEEYPIEIERTLTPNDSIEKLKTYVSNVIEGIKTGVFTYVAHPDLINFTGDREIFADEIRKICVASREYDVPLEINFLGMRDKLNYPNPFFWKLVGEEQSPVVFGFDAHDIANAYDAESLEKAKKMVDEFGLNYIGRPKIKSLY